MTAVTRAFIGTVRVVADGDNSTTWSLVDSGLLTKFTADGDVFACNYVVFNSLAIIHGSVRVAVSANFGRSQIVKEQ